MFKHSNNPLLHTVKPKIGFVSFLKFKLQIHPKYLKINTLISYLGSSIRTGYFATIYSKQRLFAENLIAKFEVLRFNNRHLSSFLLHVHIFRLKSINNHIFQLRKIFFNKFEYLKSEQLCFYVTSSSSNKYILTL